MQSKIVKKNVSGCNNIGKDTFQKRFCVRKRVVILISIQNIQKNAGIIKN